MTWRWLTFDNCVLSFAENVAIELFAENLQSERVNADSDLICVAFLHLRNHFPVIHFDY